MVLSLGVLLVLLNRKGCEHGRPARQTLHSVLNWFWNDLLGNPVGKVTCCLRCFTEANAFGEPVQNHPKGSKSKIWGLLAIASHRESLATMISDPDAFPATLIWFH